MKNSNEQTLKEAIQDLLDAYRLNDGIQSSRIIENWGKIAGDFISNNTESLYIRNQILFIRLKSPALKNELSYSKTKLIEKLNKSVNKELVKDIKFI